MRGIVQSQKQLAQAHAFDIKFFVEIMKLGSYGLVGRNINFHLQRKTLKSCRFRSRVNLEVVECPTGNKS